MAKASSRKKARRSGSAGRGTAVAVKDEGDSGVLDQKEEMKRQLMMLSPAERAELLKDVNSNDII